MYVDVYIVVTCHVNRLVKDVLELYGVCAYVLFRTLEFFGTYVCTYVVFNNCGSGCSHSCSPLRHFATLPLCFKVLIVALHANVSQ